MPVFMDTSSAKTKITEKQVEDYLVRRVAAIGGVAEKTVSLGGRGYFDRVVVLPGGSVFFVECKKPRGSHATAHQKARHRYYRALGANVRVVKTYADADRLVDGFTLISDAEG